MDSLRLRQCAAEAVGTFLLASSVGLSLAQSGAVPTPVVAGLALALMVYIIGPISGSHINPGVTCGLWSIEKIDRTQALQFIGAQVVGGIAAMVLLAAATGGRFTVPAEMSLGVFYAEAFGTAILAFGVSAAVHGKIPGAAVGFAVGGSLLLGILAAIGSNGVLNPAVAIGIGSLSWGYIVAPLAGGVVGAWAFRLLLQED